MGLYFDDHDRGDDDKSLRDVPLGQSLALTHTQDILQIECKNITRRSFLRQRIFFSRN